LSGDREAAGGGGHPLGERPGERLLILGTSRSRSYLGALPRERRWDLGPTHREKIARLAQLPPFFNSLSFLVTPIWSGGPSAPPGGGQRPAALEKRERRLEDVTPVSVPSAPSSPPLPLSKLARNRLLHSAWPPPPLLGSSGAEGDVEALPGSQSGAPARGWRTRKTRLGATSLLARSRRRGTL
jgi:hypothetical protein